MTDAHQPQHEPQPQPQPQPHQPQHEPQQQPTQAELDARLDAEIEAELDAEFGPREAPLDLPQPGATIEQAFRRFWRRYAVFSGRSSRSEYWLATLVVTVVSAVAWVLPGLAAVVSGQEGSSEMRPLFVVALVLTLGWLLAVIVPTYAMAARRLHDANFSALFLLLLFVPFGGLVVFVLTLLESRPEGARFDRR